MAMGAVRVRPGQGGRWEPDSEGQHLLLSYGKDDKEMRVAIFGGCPRMRLSIVGRPALMSNCYAKSKSSAGSDMKAIKNLLKKTSYHGKTAVIQ